MYYDILDRARKGEADLAELIEAYVNPETPTVFKFIIRKHILSYIDAYLASGRIEDVATAFARLLPRPKDSSENLKNASEYINMKMVVACEDVPPFLLPGGGEVRLRRGEAILLPAEVADLLAARGAVKEVVIR